MLLEGFLLLCWSLIAHAHSANTFNAALSRNANQSSDRSLGSKDLTPDKAVDGNTDGYFTNCASSDEYDREPWWTVDLGKDYTVSSVMIKNRDVLGERLHDFTVTVTSDNNTDTVCGQYSGQAPSDATVTVVCGQVTWGRYVTITKPTVHYSDVLTLCEVKVMAFDRTCMRFERKTGKPTTSHVTVTMTKDFPKCAHTCKNSLDCLGIYYNKDMNQCQLTNSTDNEGTIVSTGWVFYVLMP